MKKLIGACVGLIALAMLSLPAGAAASPVVTHPTGTRLDPTGKTCTAVNNAVCIVGHNVGSLLFTSGGITLSCSSAKLTGYLVKNNGTEVEGTIETASYTGTGASSKCTSSSELLGQFMVTTNVGNGVPFCIRATSAMPEMEVQIRGNSCANAARSVTFALDTLVGSCKYERTTVTGPLKGTYTTDVSGQDAVIHLSGVNNEFKGETGNPFGCPASGILDQSITLETDNALTEPLYFS